MMRRKGRVLGEMLLREVWKYKFVPKTNLVDVHMGRLRRKIDRRYAQPMIRNVRGKKFIFGIEDGQSALG
jgi:two-component system OmpR family response regulator